MGVVFRGDEKQVFGFGLLELIWCVVCNMVCTCICHTAANERMMCHFLIEMRCATECVC